MGQEASSTPGGVWKERSDGFRIGDWRNSLFRLFNHSSKASGAKSEVRPSPSFQPFPRGLGPCAVCATRLQVGDVVLVEGLEAPGGGVAFFLRELFRRSPALSRFAARIDRIKGWSRLGDSCEAITARVSPPHTLAIPRAARRATGLHDSEEVRFLWVYPAQLDWHKVFAEGCENVDPGDPDISFFTVGGYIYFRTGSRSRRRSDGSEAARALSRSQTIGAGSTLAELQLLGANVLSYDPRGQLQFSAPRRLEPACAERLERMGRFQPVAARKWAAQGARYVAWVRPGEALPDGEGHDRPLTQYGCLAFLFRELKRPDAGGGDRYFEVAAAPDFLSEATPSVPSSSSLPFSICVGPPGHLERQRARLFQLAQRGQWPLVLHVLAEYSNCARESDERGETLLHHCARHRVQDRFLLESLRDLSAPYDSKNADGKIAEDLGDRAFRSLAREIWGLAPDLFEDSERWFEFWDRNSNGRLEPCELAEALAAAYRLSDVGRRWVRSYANAHHGAGVAKARFLGPQGLLHELQFSSAFAELRQRQTPPLFRGGLPPLREEECVQLARLEERLAQLRAQNGWHPGARAPQSAHRLQMPSPFAGASLDAEARMTNARQMLSFSLAQTASFPAKLWQRGFRVNFAGQEGLDDGGLTKAWGQELAFALWGNEDYFEARGCGWCFFKPDATEVVELDGQSMNTLELYRWTGRFVAYLLYQHCLVDCCLCPWAFRVVHRYARCRSYLSPRNGCYQDWPETPEGEDHMLEDLASLDPGVASGLWRVRHEMTEDELRWLDFTCCGTELVPGGADVSVTPSNKARYVRLTCEAQLARRARRGVEAFAEGFLDVVPADKFVDLMEGGVQRLLLGAAALSDGELAELERIVVPGGLVPVKLRDHPRVREIARWFFQAVRAGNAAFRSRLLEFWIGSSRVPLTGVQAIQPRPKLQVMVQPDGRGVKRISSWPRERLPEGHTCGNELWLPLQDSYEQTVDRLRLAVENFEAGFALR